MYRKKIRQDKIAHKLISAALLFLLHSSHNSLVQSPTTTIAMNLITNNNHLPLPAVVSGPNPFSVGVFLQLSFASSFD